MKLPHSWGLISRMIKLQQPRTEIVEFIQPNGAHQVELNMLSIFSSFRYIKWSEIPGYDENNECIGERFTVLLGYQRTINIIFVQQISGVFSKNL